MKLIYLNRWIRAGSGLHVFIILFLTIGAYMMHSCKKEDDQPDDPEYWCKITAPAKGSQFQASGSIFFKAELMGFGDTASVRFSSGAILNVKFSSPPYEFNWSIPPMLTDTIYVHALASYGTLKASDSIIIYIIDTITPTIKPIPVLTVLPAAAPIDTIFMFDASQSRDTSTAFEDLLFRFDFEGDGEWDTDFTHTFRYEYKYNQVGNYQAVLEVKDTDGLIADTSLLVAVQHSSGPDPCDGYYSVPYAGKIYHLLRIGQQCWMKENLDVGSMILAGEEQGNNQIIEKYCYDNDSMNCVTYGGLYKWKEAMNHIFPVGGSRGICPAGYHIPSDEEWKELEAHADSQYALPDDVWDMFGFRGFDAGKRMKAMLGWTAGGNGNNLTGFKALASGFWDESAGFQSIAEITFLTSSTHDGGTASLLRGLSFEEDGISRTYASQGSAFSVRCLKD